ncbi:MAG TPA: FAD/NAD(P)-binding protein [Longimicrobiales bacterium]|nr:FAD/NAD(P)-binding protein [Longimicrobiales bacterium]
MSATKALAERALLSDNPYLPRMARIVRIVPMVEDNHLFTMRFVAEADADSFRHRPGQFVMMSVLGAGEAPISISSSPTRPGVLEFCVRRVGRVTDALYRLRTNDVVGIRGPYGNGFPVERMEGDDLLLVAGGLGMAPLRSLLWYALDRRDRFRDITLMYGARSPEAMLFRDELVTLVRRGDLNCLLTVDNDPDGTWPHHRGVLTDLFDHAVIDAATTHAAVCGPPIVYQFVLTKLLAMGFSKDRILMSLERRMKCGVGKCGHCGIGYKYTCVHGPIFTYWDALNLPEMV